MSYNYTIDPEGKVAIVTHLGERIATVYQAQAIDPEQDAACLVNHLNAPVPYGTYKALPVEESFGIGPTDENGDPDKEVRDPAVVQIQDPEGAVLAFIANAEEGRIVAMLLNRQRV